VAHPSGESHEVYMTPDDFLRSMTPGIKQPDGKGITVLTMYSNSTFMCTFGVFVAFRSC
jgi:hypothetical protein